MKKIDKENSSIFLLEFGRMCRFNRRFHSENSNGQCRKDCALYNVKTENGKRHCRDLIFEKPEVVVDAVIKFSAEYPVATYRTKFLEVFPLVRLNSHQVPNACAGDIYGFNCPYGGCAIGSKVCADCWEQGVYENA